MFGLLIGGAIAVAAAITIWVELEDRKQKKLAKDLQGSTILCTVNPELWTSFKAACKQRGVSAHRRLEDLLTEDLRKEQKSEDQQEQDE